MLLKQLLLETATGPFRIAVERVSVEAHKFDLVDLSFLSWLDHTVVVLILIVGLPVRDWLEVRILWYSFLSRRVEYIINLDEKKGNQFRL